MSYAEMLNREDTIAVVVDVQEKLLPAIENKDLIEKNIIKLVTGLKILDRPIRITEQYPKGLGSTIEKIKKICPDDNPYIKNAFSFSRCDELMDSLEDTDCEQIIICGVETHICVLQSALDLINEGLQVYIPADAVGSRCDKNNQNALKRLENAGAIITNVESILFELLRTSEAEEFKEISNLIK